MRRVLLAAALALPALATPAAACTFDQCWFTRPVCHSGLVECRGNVSDTICPYLWGLCDPH